MLFDADGLIVAVRVPVVPDAVRISDPTHAVNDAVVPLSPLVCPTVVMVPGAVNRDGAPVVALLSTANANSRVYAATAVVAGNTTDDSPVPTDNAPDESDTADRFAPVTRNMIPAARLEPAEVENAYVVAVSADAVGTAL
jgi:hypothetical protein